MLNHPKLIANYLIIVISSEAQWFEEVSSMLPNLPETHAKPLCKPSDICRAGLREGSIAFNNFELMRNHCVSQVPSVKQNLRKVRKLRTTLNPYEATV